MRTFLDFYPGDHAAVLTAFMLLQVTAVTSIALLAARLIFRSRPSAGSAWLLGALFCVLASPLWTCFADRLGLALYGIATVQDSDSPAIGNGPTSRPRPESDTPVATTATKSASNPSPSPSPSAATRSETKASTRTQIGAAAPDIPAVRSGADIARSAIGGLAAVWAIGLAWMAVRLVWGGWLVQRLRRSARACDLLEVRRAFEETRRVLAKPNLQPPRVSALVTTPMTLGFVRPIVLLPVRLIELTNGHGLQDVLVHEYAHLVRRDHFVGLLQRIAAAVFWLHPLVHRLNRVLSQTREEICDNYVLNAGSDRIGYARMLVELSAALLPPRAIPGLGLLQPASSLEERVAGLLDESRSRSIRAERRQIVLAALLLAATTVALAGTGRRPPEQISLAAAATAPSAPTTPPATTPTKTSKNASGPVALLVHIVDVQGKPVGGAAVGENAFGQSGQTPKWSFYAPFARSNEKGEARLQLTREHPNSILLYALDSSRKRVAFQEVERASFDRPINMTLGPACHVTGRLVSSDFDKLKRPVTWTNVYLHRGPHRSLNFVSKSQELEFYLPPGRYTLDAYGMHLRNAAREIEVKAGQTELAIGDLNLPADTLAKLFGKPAPEFRQIKGWKNGGPVTLAQLRGKVVVLDFWGYWCGPCVFDLRYWMSLHDDFAERGLVVIGIHDDSAADIADLDQKLKFCREHEWWGRDVPYLVALDGGGKTRIEGTDIDVRGATTAAYGIASFPTGILIDRDGTVLGDFAPNSPEGINQIRRLFGLPPNPDPFVLTHEPTWRKHFDAYYRLSGTETLRHIPEPFVPERTQFITSRLNRYGGVGNFPDCIKLSYTEGTPPSESNAGAGEATLGSLLYSLAPYGSAHNLFDCPRRLAKLKISGDWVVRKSASLADCLKSLEPILANDFGKLIRFELGRVDRETIVVTGRYKFQPLPGALDQGINWTASDTDLASSGGGGSGRLADLAKTLSSYYDRPFIDETAEKPSAPLSWWQRESVYATNGAKSPKKLDAVLALLARQTGLTFKRERRPVDVWHVRDVE
jgi:beta-lactamase regulating signal transducer with metallopeptidase domain/thiol-disulfide isomerase/thioredoxin